MAEDRRRWEYTDDLIAIIIVLAWVFGKFFGVDIPDWVLSVALGYAFGKSIPNGGVVRWLKGSA